MIQFFHSFHSRNFLTSTLELQEMICNGTVRTHFQIPKEINIPKSLNFSETPPVKITHPPTIRERLIRHIALTVEYLTTQIDMKCRGEFVSITSGDADSMVQMPIVCEVANGH